MHILLIHQYFLEDHAAGGSRWNEMARIWLREGHSVTVIAGNVHYMQEKVALEATMRFQDEVNRDGVRVIRCRGTQRYHRSFAGRFWGYASFAMMAVYAGFRFASDRYDCVLVTSPPLSVGIPGLILARCKRIPLILEIRDLWPESAIETGVLRNKPAIQLAYWFEKLLYHNALLICVLTPAFRERLIAQKGVCAEKLVLVPNGADFQWSEKAFGGAVELRAELGLTGKFVIIYVGAHGLANDLIQLVEAATLLSGTNAHFLLIGDGMEKASLVKEVAARGLSNVSFLNPVPKADIFKYISMADAGISVLKRLAVFQTVYSNKTFDYLSCGKPVLMAIDGVSRQLIEEAEAGLFAEPANAADLAEKGKTYMNSPALVRLHGENGHRYVRVHFDRELLALRLLSAIESHLTVRRKMQFDSPGK